MTPSVWTTLVTYFGLLLLGILGCFSWFGLGPLEQILLPTLWQQFGKGPFLFQHDF